MQTVLFFHSKKMWFSLVVLLVAGKFQTLAGMLDSSNSN